MQQLFSPLFNWQHRAQDALRTMLHNHVEARAFPCVGAKSALAHDNLAVLACNNIESAWDDVRIHDALLGWARDYRDSPGALRSLAVVFEEAGNMTEVAFEAAMWARIQSLSDKDTWRGQHYDQRVSADPTNEHFSLSFGGEAFFVVGLHPAASRPARRLPRPAMIFNLHDQFVQLRASGTYDRMRDKILARDVAIAGDVNPMLARHGEASEARQYSGRAVDADWRCPFRYGGEVS